MTTPNRSSDRETSVPHGETSVPHGETSVPRRGKSASNSEASAPDLAGMRVDYSAGLADADLAATPLEQFEAWLARVTELGIPEPNAMIVASSDADGPAARTVLCKGFDARGFTFYTNYASRKGHQIEADGRVALVFPWFAAQLQVTVRGEASRIPPAESDAYFASRPHGSQVSARASRQSRPATRAEIEHARDAVADEFPNDVPRPEGWGGFRVTVREIEFWAGRSSRLHDRLAFIAVSGAAALDDKGAWRIERRAP